MLEFNAVFVLSTLAEESCSFLRYLERKDPFFSLIPSVTLTVGVMHHHQKHPDKLWQGSLKYCSGMQCSVVMSLLSQQSSWREFPQEKNTSEWRVKSEAIANRSKKERENGQKCSRLLWREDWRAIFSLVVKLLLLLGFAA